METETYVCAACGAKVKYGEHCDDENSESHKSFMEKHGYLYEAE